MTTHDVTRAAVVTSLRGRFLADPDLSVVAGRWVLHPTSDGLMGWAATSFSAFSSDDLEVWIDHGVIFDLGRDSSWATHSAWAPAFAGVEGRYILYYSANRDGIGAAVATSVHGPFVDIGKPLVAGGAYPGRAIDPSIFVDDDGSTYLYWGNSVAHGVRLDDDLVSFDSTSVVSWEPTGFREAMWVHRRGDVYYSSWSENDTRNPTYRVRYAIGASPFGPWMDKGILLEQRASRGIKATGHHSIARIPGTDEWVIAYHRFALPRGDGFHRETVFDRLHHADDGLLVTVDPKVVSLRVPLASSNSALTREY